MMRIGQIFRTARPYDAEPAEIDGLPNYFHHTVAPDGTKAVLDSGINALRAVPSVSGPRIPAILIRSSPHKAGTKTTPWQDVFDPDHGHVRYYGDNKPEKGALAHEAPGNSCLLTCRNAHDSASEEVRRSAIPLIFFRGVSHEGRQKGQVRFEGFGVIERVELVTQWDTKREQAFSNYVFDCAVLALAAENEDFDWSWINKRWDVDATDESCLRVAPASWREWVRLGSTGLPRVRRRVGRLHTIPRNEQCPPRGSQEAKILSEVYSYYRGRQARFEALAEIISERVLGASGQYRRGWVTQAGADSGIDFVGRLDVGDGHAQAKLVALGQAKCEKLDAPTNGVHLARTVARLRRGWLGVYVTTSFFSDRVQREVIDDEYPIVLIHGLRVAQEIRKMLFETGAGLHDFLDEIDGTWADRVQTRRTEEILFE